MPFVSEAQRGAMYAAAAGKGKSGKAAKKMVKEDTGGKLPKRAKKRSKSILEAGY